MTTEQATCVYRVLVLAMLLANASAPKAQEFSFVICLICYFCGLFIVLRRPIQ